MASKKILIDIQITDAGASAAINKTAKSVDNLSNSTKRLAGRTSKNRAESGLNNAILLETSRLASDASFGFQGMANNLGQLVSLFQIAASNSGGLNAVFKDLKTSIFGVGGIIVGVQLLISFLPKIAKKFKETREKSEGLTSAIKELRKEFIELKKKIEESNDALVEQDEAIDKYLVRLRRAVKTNILFRIFGKTDFIDKTIEKLAELGVTIDKAELLRFKNDPKGLNEYIEKLIENTDKLGDVSQEITQLGTDLAVARILGEKTPLELAQMELNLFEETQEALAVKKEEYVKSKEYQVLVAKVEKARRDSERDAIKTVREGLEGGLRTTPEIEKERQEAIFKILKNGGFRTISELKNQGNSEFKIFANLFRQKQEILRNNLKGLTETIKRESQEQSEAMSKIFDGLINTTSKIGDVSKSYHDSELARLRSRKEVILQDGSITERERKSRIERIERIERQTEIRKIKAERDAFTIQQALLIAQETLKIKLHIQEQIRIQKTQAAANMATLNSTVIEGVAQAGKAKMSIGKFVSEMGAKGIIAYGLSIGGILATIISARKKAEAQIRSLSKISGGSPIGGGGGGSTVQAPDFNVVGASPESQLATAVGGAINRETPVVLRTTELDEVNNGVQTDIQTSSF